ncbi:hypothetical protein [Nitriliruptor alkaliphilus]|uniref:hypothetical protein n=1 Tax=Nitriliruptor alkaliphilus TaxID=427918 RepID=UPI000698EFC5|nr:hypothetical protein [Nitriliruptor alkaliphilus]
MRKRTAGTLLTAILLTMAMVGTATAITTIGNAATDRGKVDTWSNFTIVDTNNPASGEGSFSEVEFYAHQAGVIRFLVADAGKVVTYLSDPIDVSTAGEQTAILSVDGVATPAGVTTGSNLGVYSQGEGVVSFEYAGDAPAYFTGFESGLKDVGENLGDSQVGASERFYSMNATITPAGPATKDACKDGGWESFTLNEFRNQGECVSYLMANERAGKG